MTARSSRARALRRLRARPRGAARRRRSPPRAGEIVGVLGPNGGGKTTLFRALLGELPLRRGEVELPGPPAYVPQTERARLDFPVSALRRRADGRLRAHAVVPARRPRATATPRARRSSASGSPTQADATLRRALRRPAPARADRARAAAGRAGAAARRAALRRRRASAPRGSRRCSPSCATEGRTLLVATHDVRQAGGWDRVLCLHGRQIAYGPPAAVLTPGDAARDLRRRADRARGRRHARSASATPRALMLGWLTDPFASPIAAARARRGADPRRSPAARSASGCCSTATRTPPSRSSHGMLPGLVVAALAGAPLLLGAARGVLVAAAGIALVGARRAARRRRRRRRLRLRAVRAGRDARALARSRRRGSQELLFGDLLGVTGARPRGRRRRWRGGVALALLAGHRSLALVGFDRGAAPSLGARPARWELVLLVRARGHARSRPCRGSGTCCSWRSCSRRPPRR